MLRKTYTNSIAIILIKVLKLVAVIMRDKTQVAPKQALVNTFLITNLATLIYNSKRRRLVLLVSMPYNYLVKAALVKSILSKRNQITSTMQ